MIIKKIKARGRSLTEEHRKRISEGLKGRVFTEEHKKKMGKKGSSHPFWKGGLRKQHGYVMVLKPEHPYSDVKGYVYEHRFLVEEKLGRYLKTEEIVHHINGVRNDNEIENLKLFKNYSEHTKFHNLKRSYGGSYKKVV